jgi:transposase
VHEDSVVSPGTAVVALILNGLGFTNRRLYLTPQFFANKPVARLFDAPIRAQDLNDYTLGHALDDIAAHGVSRLFGSVAFGIALDGNSSDKKEFHETIRKVRAFQKQLNMKGDFKWVADSALYSADRLLAENDYL